MRLIDADELTFDRLTDSICQGQAEDVVAEAPTIEAEPVRCRGRWEEVEVMPEAYDIAGVKTWASRLRCSNCGFTTVAIEGGFAQYNYCPSCGAKKEDIRRKENR